MFPRRARLPREAFTAALKGGRRVHTEHLTIIVPQRVRGYAVVVPKKVARSSVVRHRIKRRILAAMRPLSLPPALVVFPKASVVELSSAALNLELSAALNKISR